MPKYYRKKSRPNSSNDLGRWCPPSTPNNCNTNRKIDQHLMFDWLIPAKKSGTDPGWSEKIDDVNLYYRWPLAGWYFYTANPWFDILRLNESFFKKRLLKYHHSIKVWYPRYDPGTAMDTTAEFYDGTPALPLIKGTDPKKYYKFKVRDMTGVTVKVHMYYLSYKGWRAPSTGWRLNEIFTKPQDPFDSGICSTFKVLAHKKYEHCIGSDGQKASCGEQFTYSLTWNGNIDACLYARRYDNDKESVFVADNYIEVILYWDSNNIMNRPFILSEPLKIPEDVKDTGSRTLKYLHPGICYHNYKYVEWQDVVKAGYSVPQVINERISGAEACNSSCSIVIQAGNDPNLPKSGMGQSCAMDEDDEPPPPSPEDPLDITPEEVSLVTQENVKKKNKKSVFFG